MSWPRRAPDRRSVLIPIVAPGAEAGRLLHVLARAGEAGPAVDDPRKLDRTIAALYEHRLYRAGLAALGAVARVARRPTPLLGGWLGTGDTGHGAVLTAVNGQDFKGLTEDNAGSAELGLALALMMQAGRSGPAAVYATGALDRGATLDGVAAPGVAILPVGGLVAKLAAVGASVGLADGGAGASRTAHLFLPDRTLDGQTTAHVHRAEIAQLVATFAARGVTLAVHPVATLDQALDVLGIRRLPRPPRERAAIGLALTGIAAAAIGIGAWGWLTGPVTLAFGTLAAPNGASIATPFATKIDVADGRLVPRPVCRGPDGVPLFRAGEQLVMKIEVTDETPLVRHLGGTRFAIIGLSEISGVREWPEELIGGDGTAPLLVRIPIADGTPETNTIVVLAQRVRRFSGLALRDDVRAVMDKAPREERLNAALAYLARRAPGHLVYKLATAGEDARCGG